MKTIMIKDVPDEVRRRFKVHCAQMGISMKEAILRLMDLEVEQRILFSPVEPENEIKKGKPSR